MRCPGRVGKTHGRGGLRGYLHGRRVSWSIKPEINDVRPRLWIGPGQPHAQMDIMLHPLRQAGLLDAQGVG